MSVYIKNGSTIIEISRSSASNSKLLETNIINNTNFVNSKTNPFTIDPIDDKNMTFILKYLDYFSDKPESEPPIAPLPRLDISNIFGAEYDLYANLCESDIPLSDRLYIIKHYIDHAVYFQIKYLPDKMAAILVYLLRDKSQIELESLI